MIFSPPKKGLAFEKTMNSSQEGTGEANPKLGMKL